MSLKKPTKKTCQKHQCHVLYALALAQKCIPILKMTVQTHFLVLSQ